MKYIKVTGKSFDQAFGELRRQYGSEAVIYEKKTVAPRKIFSRIMGRKEYEIHAAIKEKEPQRNNVQDQISRLENIVRKAPEQLDQKAQNDQNVQMAKSSIEREIAPNIVSQIHQGKSFLEELGKKTDLQTKTVNQSESTELEKLRREMQIIRENLSRMSLSGAEKITEKEFRELYNALIAQDCSQEWAGELISELQNSMPRSEWKMRKRIGFQARQLIASKIRVQNSPGSRKAIALIGPTGVGKTTTVAKLAARFCLQDKESLALVTIDNFRIAATEQLKSYARIIRVPFYVCKEPEALIQLVEDLDADRILIDTTGISHMNKEFLSYQKEFFKGMESLIEPVLTLSAVTRREVTVEIMEEYAMFNYRRMILTKTDETRILGQFAEISAHSNTPLAWFTDGQDVPENIMPAEREFLAGKILEKYENS